MQEQSVTSANVLHIPVFHTNPRALVVARSNWAFFAGAMVSEMYSLVFGEAVFQGQHRPHVHDCAHVGFPARLRIDATPLYDEKESYQSAFHKAVEEAASRIPGAITGDLFDRVAVEAGEYRFEFRITGYWLAKFPGSMVTTDPLHLPEGELFGRDVDLKVTVGM